MTERRVGPPKAVPGGRGWPNDHDHDLCYWRTSAACTGFGRTAQPRSTTPATAQVRVRPIQTRQTRHWFPWRALLLVLAVAAALLYLGSR